MNWCIWFGHHNAVIIFGIIEINFAIYCLVPSWHPHASVLCAPFYILLSHILGSKISESTAHFECQAKSVMGNFIKINSSIYLKFLIGVLNQALYINPLAPAEPGFIKNLADHKKRKNSSFFAYIFMGHLINLCNG